MSINPSFLDSKVPVSPGTKTLSPEVPLTTRGGTTSGRPSYSYVQDSGPPFSKEMSIVNQETRPTPKQTATSATTKISMGKETPLSNADKKEVLCHLMKSTVCI